EVRAAAANEARRRPALLPPRGRDPARHDQGLALRRGPHDQGRAEALEGARHPPGAGRGPAEADPALRARAARAQCAALRTQVAALRARLTLCSFPAITQGCPENSGFLILWSRFRGDDKEFRVARFLNRWRGPEMGAAMQRPRLSVIVPCYNEK